MNIFKERIVILWEIGIRYRIAPFKRSSVLLGFSRKNFDEFRSRSFIFAQQAHFIGASKAERNICQQCFSLHILA